ncbi:alpha/beta fold hydrolase [Leucobacter sp. cx-328]|uniref:alpha/beta hydrolase n=1 Tax=unclassified Leucobacter TaxID=2621730 RepID=UPI00165D9629|nr:MULTISPECIES: alpha/beta fold hydrolase [unclassified Leucobacter]MBC9944753.1 alpha/beta fold hydrolase [Leucobacter sp. cx-328]
MKRQLAIGGAMFGAAGAALGWTIARKLTAPVGPRRFNLTLRGVEVNGDRQLLLLDRTCDTEAPGTYNLWFEHGGWAQLGSEVEDRGQNQVARVVVGVSPGLTPREGDRVSWSGIYFATPADAGLDASDIVISTAVGHAHAWRIKSNMSTWAIHIHGLGSPRAGTLRGVQVATELGLNSLVTSYRNDGEGPAVGSVRSALGITETEDVEAAISYAVRRGAERIILFGWSMGAAIAVRLAQRSDYAPLIAGLVLDSPVLNWPEVIKANCQRAGLPRSAGLLAVPWLAIGPLARLMGLPARVSLQEFDWVTHAEELSVPTLILHGASDDSVPIKTSLALAKKRPDLVQLECFDAGHTLSWNSDAARWRATVSTWLSDGLAS